MGDDGMGQVSAPGHPVPDIVANPAGAAASDQARVPTPDSIVPTPGSIVPTPGSIVPTPGSPHGHGGPQPSIGGWIIRVSGVEEDVQETDLHRAFSAFGKLRNLHLNPEPSSANEEINALLEYDQFEEAEEAIKQMNGKQLFRNIVHVDWAFRRGPNEKAMSKRSGFPYPIDIMLAVRRSLQPFRHMEEKARNVFAQHSHEESFLQDTHSAIVRNYDQLKALGPHPLLEVVTPENSAPYRWIHCGINAEGTDDWIVFFMRIDNLYTRGFQNRYGAYELTQAPMEQDGIKSVQPSILPSEYKCVLLNWDVQYSKLFGCKDKILLETTLQKIARDKDYIFESVQVLSNWKHEEGSENEAEVKKRLAAIIFFLCEYFRMNLSSDTPGEVATDLIDKAQTWGDVCHHLLNWRSSDFTDWYTSREYKEPPRQFLLLKDLNINSAADALQLERLILNRNESYFDKEGKNPNKLRDNWKADDKRRAQKRRRLAIQDFYQGAGSAKSSYSQGAPLEADSLQLGRRRIQLLSLRANFSIDWVDCHDWHRSQAIYRKELIDGQVEDDMERDLALVGPTRALGAYGTLGVEVLPSETSRIGVRDTQIVTNHKGAFIKCWDVGNYDDEEPTLHFKDVDGLFKGQRLRLCYMLVPNTIEAGIFIELNMKGRGGFHKVKGQIEAWNSSTGGKRMVLFSQQDVDVPAGKWTQLPLMVSLLCLPYAEDPQLHLYAHLTIHRHGRPEDANLEARLLLSRTGTVRQYQDKGNIIRATLSLANKEGPRTFAQRTVIWKHPLTKWAQRSDKVYLTIELYDAKELKFKVTRDGHFYFLARGSDGIMYEVDLDLYGDINVEESKESVSPRAICYLIKKAKTNWWPRLLKRRQRRRSYQTSFIKIDMEKFKWQTMKEKTECSDDVGDMDFSKLNMGGADDGEDIEEDDERGDSDYYDAINADYMNFWELNMGGADDGEDIEEDDERGDSDYDDAINVLKKLV